jgi:hypothetical protein
MSSLRSVSQIFDLHVVNGFFVETRHIASPAGQADDVRVNDYDPDWIGLRFDLSVTGLRCPLIANRRYAQCH